jgi:hypothetical protein
MRRQDHGGAVEHVHLLVDAQFAIAEIDRLESVLREEREEILAFAHPAAAPCTRAVG